jgi:hypothetical protein
MMTRAMPVIIIFANKTCGEPCASMQVIVEWNGWPMPGNLANAWKSGQCLEMRRLPPDRAAIASAAMSQGLDQQGAVP